MIKPAETAARGSWGRRPTIRATPKDALSTEVIPVATQFQFVGPLEKSPLVRRGVLKGGVRMFVPRVGRYVYNTTSSMVQVTVKRPRQ